MARKRNSYPEYRHSPWQSDIAEQRGISRKAVELPKWCDTFISILKSSESAAAALLATLTPEQYEELAYRLAGQANIERWSMLTILDNLR